MGTGVFGGMIIATFVATIFIPLFFALMSRRGQVPETAHGKAASAPPSAIAEEGR